MARARATRSCCASGTDPAASTAVTAPAVIIRVLMDMDRDFATKSVRPGPSRRGSGSRVEHSPRDGRRDALERHCELDLNCSRGNEVRARESREEVIERHRVEEVDNRETQ